MNDLSLLLIIIGSICFSILFAMNFLENYHPYVFLLLAYIVLFCFVGAFTVRLLGTV